MTLMAKEMPSQDWFDGYHACEDAIRRANESDGGWGGEYEQKLWTRLISTYIVAEEKAADNASSLAMKSHYMAIVCLLEQILQQMGVKRTESLLKELQGEDVNGTNSA